MMHFLDDTGIVVCDISPGNIGHMTKTCKSYTYDVAIMINIRYVKNLQEKNGLPGRESNPGLARDRRGYSPLYYRGLVGVFEHAALIASNL
ncbi:unnamed protein product [Toxocara canis]|uniref:Transposase n=1 Tax=Toxocara canis TaxID=6265 RepID=A0A183TWA9_TOXCA|nr:unnamed protein product [Toxocara canis]